MTARIVVVGAAGFGRESLDVLGSLTVRSSAIEVSGVLDDSPSPENLARLEARGTRYLSSVDDYLAGPVPDSHFVVGIGDPRIRSTVHSRFVEAGLAPFSAAHPSSVIGEQSTIGAGAVICAGALISTNVALGEGVHVNPGATIGHDAVLEDFVSINPGAIISGEVSVGTASLIGAGAIVLQGLRIGEGSIVGAGAVVTKDVPTGAIVKGVPGRW